MGKIDLHDRVLTSELNGKKAGSEAVLAGWVQETRDLGKLFFIILRDREGLAQIVVPSDFKGSDSLKKLHRESVVTIRGKVQDAKSTKFKKELKISDFDILSVADPNLPIEFIKEGIETGLENRLDYRWIDLRNPKNLLIFKIETDFEHFSREFFLQEGCLEIHSPKLMGSPSESGAELFEVPYFEKTAYLAQSPQFYKQMAMAAGFEKVFEIGPVFRANPSHTTRHDTEFISLDIELSWIESPEDVMSFEERWIVAVFKRIDEKYGNEIKKVFGVDLAVPKIPFPRMSLKEAKKIIKELTGRTIPEDEDLDSESEKIICDYAKKKYGHEFVFVTEYPWAIKPFYHMRSEKDPSVTKGFDLLFSGLEITTGAQREHRYDILTKQAKEKKLNTKHIQSYLDFFRWGVGPHGGFGLSPTRVVMKMLDLPNVREATFLPRDTERLTP